MNLKSDILTKFPMSSRDPASKDQHSSDLHDPEQLTAYVRSQEFSLKQTHTDMWRNARDYILFRPELFVSNIAV